MLQAKAKQALLPGRHADSQLVTRVARRIIAALPQPMPGGAYVAHLARCDWEFAVVHSPTANAVVLPGGKVVVYTGLAPAAPPRFDVCRAATLSRVSPHGGSRKDGRVTVRLREHAQRVSVHGSASAQRAGSSQMQSWPLGTVGCADAQNGNKGAMKINMRMWLQGSWR